MRVNQRLRTILPDLWATVRWRVRDRSRHYTAHVHRLRLTGVTFIGITGSAGKTTTKDLVTGILSGRAPCHSYRGSGNDHEMVDRMVLDTSRRHRFSVVEVSATEPGYLNRSLRLLRPKIGVLTLIANEHYAAYRTLDAVAAEKRKLVDALPRDGTAVLNIDDPFVRAIGEQRAGPVIWVGNDEAATIRLLEVQSCWPEPLTLRISHEGTEHVVRTRLHGTHLALPVLCALGVAVATKTALPDAIAAIALIDPSEGRMQVEDAGDGVIVIRDDFKAPEWSFAAPLQLMRDARAARKVVVIGSISDSPREDSTRYARAAQQGLDVADLVVLVGTNTLSTSRARRMRGDGSLQLARSVRDAAAILRRELRAGDLVLLKGTNKQDHLVRLLLDRRRPVQCWTDSCGRQEFCGECSRVYRATDIPAHPATPVPRGIRTGTPIVVGLGNPGSHFANTPHNLGHTVLDAIVEDVPSAWDPQPEGLVATLAVEGVDVIMFKPSSFINESGPALAQFIGRLGAGPEDCIVVLDDFDLTLGSARLKRDGGDAGHKGMRSIITALGTDTVARVRIGVRRDGEARRAGEIVLAQFTHDDRALLAAGLKRADTLLRGFIKDANRLPESVSMTASPASRKGSPRTA